MELNLSNVTKNFKGLTAVDRVSCTFGPGVYGLLGVNGAGKTTLMRMLCTLLRPSAGSIELDGQDIFSLGGAYRARLGYLPQDFGFYPDLTVRDYLLYISSIKGLRPATARQRSGELMELTGLQKAAGRKMKRLSGGMKRRVGITQALLNDPEILILDEPTAGLDPGERIRFRNLLSEIARDRLVLLSTHIVSDVEYIAGQILLMKDGRIAASGTVEGLTSRMPLGVWRCVVPHRQAEELLRRYKVANIRAAAEGTELRILAERAPVSGAEPEPPTLEDLFLYTFGGEGGKDHDKI